MSYYSKPIPFIFLLACVFLQGCQSLTETLGLDRRPPNEYAVTPTSQLLEMPPDFSCLPPPMPGIERPQDREARRAQEEKILGSASAKESFSPGQEALLTMCEARSGQDHIRYKIDAEARMENAKAKTIVEKLGIKKPTLKEALDPYEESLELQKQGIPPNPRAPREITSSSRERTSQVNGNNFSPSLPPLQR